MALAEKTWSRLHGNGSRGIVTTQGDVFSISMTDSDDDTETKYQVLVSGTLEDAQMAADALTGCPRPECTCPNVWEQS